MPLAKLCFSRLGSHPATSKKPSLPSFTMKVPLGTPHHCRTLQAATCCDPKGLSMPTAAVWHRARYGLWAILGSREMGGGEEGTRKLPADGSQRAGVTRPGALLQPPHLGLSPAPLCSIWWPWKGGWAERAELRWEPRANM